MHAGKCLGTFDEVLVHSAHANGDTYLEGTNITFTCSPGLVLSGPNSSTCTRNGEWEPSPKEVECKGEGRNGKQPQCHVVAIIMFLQLIVVYLG